MTTFNLTSLSQKLPDQSITWGGFGQPVMINANNVTGDTLTLDANAIETVAKLLDGLIRVQQTINQERTSGNSSNEPINMITRVVEYDVETDETFVVFNLKVKIDPQVALNNVIDPSV